MRLKNIAFVALLVSSCALAEELVVYRSPDCGCCGKWLQHVKQHFSIKDVVTDDMQAIKQRYRVTASLASCHTAIIGSYVIEGHVPADDIEKLLKTRPNIAGLAVPGMPSGTPGMEMAGKKESYDVLSFDANGKTAVFSHHAGN